MQESFRQEIIEVCRALYQRNLLAAADGNVSVRLDDQRILITPSGLPKAFIEPKDIAVVTIDNEILEGNPSGERLMHLEVYRKCPEAKCVVHAHPPTAVAWSIARPDLEELPSESLSEVILAVGSIPFVKYARPGTIEMGTHLHPYLPKNRVMVLSRHGALSWGESLREALNGMERLEHSAQMLMMAESLGGITNLPEDEVKALREMRTNMGDKSL